MQRFKDFICEEDEKYYAIATQTRKGWRRVPDTRFGSIESATAYGDKYHRSKDGYTKFYKVVEHPDNKRKKY